MYKCKHASFTPPQLVFYILSTVRPCQRSTLIEAGRYIHYQIVDIRSKPTAMCIAIITTEHPDYPFILLNNRDVIKSLLVGVIVAC